ncbi:uncharacterized protein L3040_008442 [Drepanopeziza brunnea f. sp. 'multigermtubi']|uniref:uncharacterized protein n=1 Tax=Drepanopeziza brunnea f. sp. 'multigermtubi' TaxID=698441 RepID=UPI002390AB42|nr:hypothetical protein L3040_008442 [Drepanopeziza brunnea f. sp. 'multigermtubi']
MHLKSPLMVAAVGTVAAQKSSISICDKYTTALFHNNTAENQLKLLTAVVNTAVIGNYSETQNGVAVPGILAPAVVNGEKVDLLPYFNGCFASTNRGNGVGQAIDFLDDGGAAPLGMGKPSNGIGTRQYLLLTHLYQYFGMLLDCSQQGGQGSAFPKYQGLSSMYTVHKFMNLHPAEVTYFIEQVAAAAISFGVTPEDIAPVGLALNRYFNYRCLPSETIIETQGAHYQSICSAQDCPTATNSSCAAYANIADPEYVCNKTAPVSDVGYPTNKIPSTLAPAQNTTTVVILCGGLICSPGCTPVICPHGGYFCDGKPSASPCPGEAGDSGNTGYVCDGKPSASPCPGEAGDSGNTGYVCDGKPSASPCPGEVGDSGNTGYVCDGKPSASPCPGEAGNSGNNGYVCDGKPSASPCPGGAGDSGNTGYVCDGKPSASPCPGEVGDSGNTGYVCDGKPSASPCPGEAGDSGNNGYVCDGKPSASPCPGNPASPGHVCTAGNGDNSTDGSDDASCVAVGHGPVVVPGSPGSQTGPAPSSEAAMPSKTSTSGAGDSTGSPESDGEQDGSGPGSNNNDGEKPSSVPASIDDAGGQAGSGPGVVQMASASTVRLGLAAMLAGLFAFGFLF